MSRFGLFTVASLIVIIGVARTEVRIGERLEGDQVLLSKNVRWDRNGEQAHINVSYPGKIITRISLHVPFFREESLFDLEIIEGGIFSDHVELKVHWLTWLRTPMRLRIYGMDVETGKGTVNHHGTTSHYSSSTAKSTTSSGRRHHN